MRTDDGEIGMNKAYAGLDSRLDDRGVSHPWRLVVHDAGRSMTIQFIGPLPFDRRWLSVPRDPLYGDLVGLSGATLEARAYDIAGRLGQDGIGSLIVTSRRGGEGLMTALEREGVRITVDDDADEMLVGETLVSSLGIAGMAGSEIEALLTRGGDGR